MLVRRTTTSTAALKIKRLHCTGNQMARQKAHGISMLCAEYNVAIAHDEYRPQARLPPVHAYCEMTLIDINFCYNLGKNVGLKVLLRALWLSCQRRCISSTKGCTMNVIPRHGSPREFCLPIMTLKNMYCQKTLTKVTATKKLRTLLKKAWAKVHLNSNLSITDACIRI